MPPKDLYADLKVYQKHLSRKSNQTITCPRCRLFVSPKDFEKHCSEKHNSDPKTSCVWCLGQVTWPSGSKSSNAKHLLECFKRFCNPEAPAVEVENCRLLDVQTLLCEPREFFGHEPLNPSFYDSLSSPWLPSFQLYRHDSLNLAAAHIQFYLQTQESHDWFHLMVKAITFESFLQALRAEGNIHISEFSCWCDGGHHAEVELRQHRHLLVASAPQGRFENRVWKKVKITAPYRNFPSKRLKRIQSPIHLVNALGYLSKRESRCNFSFEKESDCENLNHFYIFTPLPVHYKLPLVLLWSGGVKELLIQEQFQNVSISSLVETPLFKVRNLWMQKIKDFYKPLERGLVMPVSGEFVPCEEQQRYAFHLTDSRKIYFKPSRSNDRWLEKQVRGGNVFYDALDEEVWIPRPGDQKRLNETMPYVEAKRKLESENESLKRINQNLEKQVKKLKAENECLKKKSNITLNNCHVYQIQH